jgi:hypothetical protein
MSYKVTYYDTTSGRARWKQGLWCIGIRFMQGNLFQVMRLFMTPPPRALKVVADRALPIVFTPKHK